jgi:protein gp37
MTKRLKAMKQPKYLEGFKVVTHPRCLNVPVEIRKPSVIFVNSMSDLFHAEVPEEFIRQVFDVMVKCPQHVFQVLTKRSERLREMAPRLPWTENIWMGVTVESADYYGRIHDLMATPAKVKFLSLEPLLSSISDIPIDGIDWAIAAGETGSKARPMEASWVQEVKNRCVQKNIPFFFKQWGGKGKANKLKGRILDGRTWGQMPLIRGNAIPLKEGRVP